MIQFIWVINGSGNGFAPVCCQALTLASSDLFLLGRWEQKSGKFESKQKKILCDMG